MKGNDIIDAVSFNYNEKQEGYGRIIAVGGNDVLVEVREQYVDDVNKCLQIASETINDLDIDVLNNAILDQMHELNSDWYGLTEDDKPKSYTKDEYISKIRLKTINVDDNYVEYIFDDNGIYSNHDIVVTKNLKTNKLSVDLMG